ncbi:hypothetical protein BHM03_00011214 [Ensete ventricosum]|nr:hypothetical protein BHM03_00011214 [Ensete ventricosum]
MVDFSLQSTADDQFLAGPPGSVRSAYRQPGEPICTAQMATAVVDGYRERRQEKRKGKKREEKAVIVGKMAFTQGDGVNGEKGKG